MSIATITTTILRGMVKAVLWLVGTVVVLVVVFVVVLVAINALDERLAPDAQALMAPVPQSAVSDANGYVEFLGFDAPEGQTTREFGMEKLQAYRAQETPGAPKFTDAKVTIVPGGTTKLLDQDAAWCRPEIADCLARSAADAMLPALLKKYAKGLERYRAIRDKPEYSQLYIPARSGSGSPSFGALTYGHLVSLLDVAQKLNAGQFDDAVAELEKEMAFHFRAAVGARNMVDQLVAGAMLARDALFISEVFRTRRDAMAPYRARIAAMLDSPSPRAFSITEALRNETRLQISFASDPDWTMEDRERELLMEKKTSTWWVLLRKFAYRPNATANLIAEDYRFKEGVTKAPATAFDAAEADEKARVNLKAVPGWDWIVNPAGKIHAPSDISHYVARMHDTAALLKLVSLQLALYEKAPSADAVATVLAGKTGKAFANPYTGKPMDFDAKSNTLFFVPRGNGGWIRELKTRFNGKIAVAL